MQSWGALVAGHVQQRAVPEAVAALARFCQLGGQPDSRMVDAVVGLCLAQRDRHHAVKVSLFHSYSSTVIFHGHEHGGLAVKMESVLHSG